MVARGLALAAATFVAAGCGGRVYSDADAQRAAGTSADSATVVAYGDRDFATWAAVTELELDPDPLYSMYAGSVDVLRFASAHDARARLRSGLGWISIRPSTRPVLVQRGNLLLVGDRAAVNAALRRLPR